VNHADGFVVSVRYLGCRNELRTLETSSEGLPTVRSKQVPTPNLQPAFDFTDPDIYAERLPVDELAEMRKVAPVWWNEQPIGIGGFDDGGYWVVTKHKDVKEVSLRSDVFSSPEKTAVPRHRGAVDARSLAEHRTALLHMDAPRHTHLRKIVSRAFTPRAIERLRDELRQRAHTIARAAAAERSGDFVEQVSSELPLQATAELMGVPQEDRMKLFHPDHVVSADRARGHRTVWRQDHQRPARGDVLSLGQLRRGRVRGSVYAQHHARSQASRRVRRHWGPLLHRREPGEDDDRPDVERYRRRDAGPDTDCDARAATVRLA
jgi:cytochrome P450